MADSTATHTLAERVRRLKLPEDVDRSPRRWRQRLPWALWLVTLAVCLLLAGQLIRSKFSPQIATGSKPASPAQYPSEPPNQDQPNPDKVVLEALGYVVPVRKVQVSPKVGGQILRLYIEEGKYVKAGELIAEIDPTKFQHERDRRYALWQQAKARYELLKAGNRPEEIHRAEAAWLEAQAALRQAENDWKRLRLAGRVATPEELDRSESALQQARQRERALYYQLQILRQGSRPEEIRQAEAEMLASEAAYRDAEYDLQNTKVLAPITGVVLTKRADVGDIVLPNVPSNLSASICDLADLRNLEVEVDISERDLQHIRRNQRCEIRPDALPQQVLPGKVSRIIPQANRSKASVSVRVAIFLPDDVELLPDTRARVRFFAGTMEER
ncbi:MAG: efflux RND transporter periplasmic adaptor subunit [Gemmatales bacterium]|nr:efflux RND transporter periplasmic adaptor subunit [Gemmatales bacterium]MDW7994555.1 efflux RND transporter periplasmic adaptor subunit [Gemmatales bacterium]